MKILRLLFIFLLLSVNPAKAQFLSATIGIDGLTCSMCSFSVDKSLKQLDFVREVEMDLNKNVALVTFLPGKKVSIEKLARKVVDAGYSVRNISAVFLFKDAAFNENIFEIEKERYYVMNQAEGRLQGEVIMTFLGRTMMSRKEYARSKSRLEKIEKMLKENKPDYFVTLGS